MHSAYSGRVEKEDYIFRLYFQFLVIWTTETCVAVHAATLKQELSRSSSSGKAIPGFATLSHITSFPDKISSRGQTNMQTNKQTDRCTHLDRQEGTMYVRIRIVWPRQARAEVIATARSGEANSIRILSGTRPLKMRN